MTDRYVTIWKQRRSRRPKGVYPLPFKILKETATSYQIEVTDEMQAQLRNKGMVFGTYFSKEEGIRTRREVGHSMLFYASKAVVLGVTTKAVLHPSTDALNKACEAFEKCESALNVRNNQINKEFEAEAESIRAQYDAAKAALAAKKKQAVEAENAAQSEAYSNIWKVVEAAKTAPVEVS